jgi:hypothetical protein
MSESKPMVRAGDVVLYLRNARRMYVEKVEGLSAFVAWYDGGELCRGWYGARWLVPSGVALA